MNLLAVYSLAQAKQWDVAVRSFHAYDVYWLSGYVKAFQLNGDGEPLLFFYDDGSLRGINVVLKRDVAKDPHFVGRIPEGTWFDLSVPYGYGGWLLEGDGDAEPLFESYSEWIRKNGLISEFVRFHPMLQNHERCRSFYDVVQLGKVVHMDLSSPETIWANISSKNRNMIRKAINQNVRVYHGCFPEIISRFREIYNKTMEEDEASSYYFFEPEFYDSILNDLAENAQVFWAEKDGQVIAASIMLAANGHLNYHLSGSRREYRSLAAGNLILYRAALWGSANGCKTFYLGGGVGSGEDSLFHFKRAFYRGELSRFYIGKKVYDPEKYDALVSMRGQVESGFFPKYRA